MEISAWISNNELLNGIAAVIVIFDFWGLLVGLYLRD